MGKGQTLWLRRKGCESETHGLDLPSVLHLFDAGKQSMQISQFVQIEDGSACILSRTKVTLPLLMREQLKEKKVIFEAM